MVILGMTKKVLVGSLTKACKIINDKIHTRLPIQCSLLELIMFEVQRIYGKTGQIFLQILCKALFVLSYYGLMRISEVTKSSHVVKAKDVYLATNRDKLGAHQKHILLDASSKNKVTSNLTEKSGCYAKR